MGYKHFEIVITNCITITGLVFDSVTQLLLCVILDSEQSYEYYIGFLMICVIFWVYALRTSFILEKIVFYTRNQFLPKSNSFLLSNSKKNNCRGLKFSLNINITSY